jgi:hypothetical protein
MLFCRDSLHTHTNPHRVAASVTDTANVFLVPAFSGLAAPHGREDARLENVLLLFMSFLFPRFQVLPRDDAKFAT